MRNHPPKFGVLSIETLVQKWKVGGTQGGTREILCGGPIGSGFYQINCLPVERISPCSTLTIPGKHIRFLACVFMNWEAKNRHNTPVLAMEIQVMSSRPRALAEIQRQRMRCQSVIAIEVRANNLHRKVHFGQQANHLMLLRRAETQSKESRPKFDPPLWLLDIFPSKIMTSKCWELCIRKLPAISVQNCFPVLFSTMLFQL